MTRRHSTLASAARQAAAAIPMPPAREPYHPPWEGDHAFGPQFSFHQLGSWAEHIQRGILRLPRFQRPFVWTDHQIARAFDSLIKGYHVGSLLLWERYGQPATSENFGGVNVEAQPDNHRCRLVVDGQQRLGAIAQVLLTDRWWFDMRAGAVDTAGPGAWRVPMALVGPHWATMDAFRWLNAHVAEHGMDADELRDTYAAIYNVTSGRTLSAVVLPESMPLTHVLESFRRLNTEGTRMSMDELGAALARFEAERNG